MIRRVCDFFVRAIAIVVLCVFVTMPLSAAQKAFQDASIGAGGLWASPDISLVAKDDIVITKEAKIGDWTDVEVQNGGAIEIQITYNPVYKDLRMHDFYPSGSTFLKPGERASFKTNTGQWYIYVYKAKDDYLRVPGNYSPEWHTVSIQAIVAEKMARERFQVPISDAFQRQLDKLN
jgi:hypothetical protein